MAEAVLITTDDLEPAVRLRAAFEGQNLRVELLAPGEALDDALAEPILVVITGGLRERRARALVQAARERGRTPIIGLTEPTEPSGRDICRQLGIHECFAKPIDADEVALVGRRLVQRQELREITGIVGETAAMEEVLERIVQIAPVNSTVLILGESGTGKELVARGIHALSPRRHRPFIAVNVAALPENLLESELFGHEKGSFTGATDRRKGFFELANGGSIFLDEIGEMPLSTQTKLLRVLEEREFRRVGGEESIRVDVRVIAATNRDMRQEVEVGEFRRDLYHRLNVLRIELPPLRARREDVPRLIEGFIRQFSAEHERPFLGIDPEALEILVNYDWPGNVRELKNLIESMVVLAPGRVIRPEDIPPEVR
ncbi:MAG TPA: sigma-54 dependent transcriptional regulator, partial [Longimicrobium sp.]|nr:sigma-54 dependent transcriptional regulator [Longimicrobium sp.]